MARRLKDRYEIVALVARGGQGELVRAVDTMHNRDVAIKIRRDVSGAEREDLLAEARVLLSLEPHAALPRVREDFFAGDEYFLVQEWVQGRSLGQLLDERGGRGLPYALVLPVLTEVARALDHLHSHRPPVVHGDVKPANLILTDEGRTVLVDFGLAHVAGTRPGGPGGTPGYIAPEVLAGEHPSPAADVYAFASTAVALLTGRPPQGGRPHWEGVPAGALAPLESALEAALATDPGSRPRSASEVAELLASWLRGHIPTGTVTLLMTEVEGSARMWGASTEAMRTAIRRHDALAAGAVEDHGGVIVGMRRENDGVLAAFARASDAAAAAVAFQRAVGAESWPDDTPIRVRVALHSGGPDLRELGYHGPEIHRCAGLRSVAHPGQIVLSKAAAALVRGALGKAELKDAALTDLGEHLLKDLARPEHVFQLSHPDGPNDFPPLRSLDSRPNNLPVQLTTFVGRQQELAGIAETLRTSRLATLTGAGGCGKTRLALQSAAELVDGYRDGVWFAELGSLADPAFVAQVVGSLVGVSAHPGRDPTAALIDVLGDKTVLLVLDNCEHLVLACASLAESVLRSCANVKILATSREPLRVPGEAVRRIPGMSVPPADGSPVDGPSGSEAVRLFTERAFAADATFVLDERNAGSVAEICRRLDGIPLAIELAAARVATLRPQDIALRLSDRFRVLGAGARTAIPRHETLRALVDWSYGLVPPDEQRIFARLSVFAGRFTLEAAEGICSSDDLDVLGALDALVTKSLVVADEAGDRAQYHLLETLREYATEKLEGFGEVVDLSIRHLAFYAEFAERAASELWGPDQERWLVHLDHDYPNLRKALAWSLEPNGSLENGLRIAGSLWRFWITRAKAAEVAPWLETALASADGVRPDVRARALAAAGQIALRAKDPHTARERLEEALAIHRARGNKQGMAFCLLYLGGVAMDQGELHIARALFEEALPIAIELGDTINEIALRDGLAGVALLSGDAHSARRLVKEALAASREAGDKLNVVNNLVNSGLIECALDETERARTFYEEALDISRTIGHVPGILHALAGVARLAVRRRDYRTARKFLDELLPLANEAGDGVNVAEALYGLGLCDLTERSVAQARSLFAECAGMARSLKQDTLLVAALDGLARSEVASGNELLAVELFAVTAERRKPHLFDSEGRDSALAAARSALPAHKFDEAWKRAHQMTLLEAAELALGAQTSVQAGPK